MSLERVRRLGGGGRNLLDTPLRTAVKVSLAPPRTMRRSTTACGQGSGVAAAARQQLGKGEAAGAGEERPARSREVAGCAEPASPPSAPPRLVGLALFALDVARALLLFEQRPSTTAPSGRRTARLRERRR